jgi:hypothetical protein
VKLVFLAVAALVAQRMLGWPGLPSWAVLPMLPMAIVVGIALTTHDRRWPIHALLLGLVWDLMLESVIGPGGIAWSAAGLVLAFAASVVADRSSRAWFAGGAVGASTVIVARQLALLPLGLATRITAGPAILTVLATAVWCGFVGWLIALDLPSQWQRYRARRLRS